MKQVNTPFVPHRIAVVAASLVLASVALVGCNRAERDVARTDTAPNSTVVAPTAPMARTEAERSVDAAKNAGEATGSKVSDAVITTSVNAQLVKDPSLSALKIDVDTSAGRVALKGAAPSEAARARATQLASAVKGVVSVDNQLRVEKM